LAFVALKNLWRNELIETPKMCASDVPVSECMWVCAEGIESNAVASDAMYLMGIEGNTTHPLPDADNVPYYDIILRTAFCETPFWPGDHLEAASPVEASFWPIHPTIDRLLQYKDLATPFVADAYGMEAVENSDGSYSIITDTTELCSDTGEQGPYNKTCYGHNPYDVTFFKSTHKLQDGTYTQTHLTNWEVRQNQMVKGNYGLPYLYNHYEFDHCDEAYGMKFKTVDDAEDFIGDDS
jgi:hypothetical protein